MSNKNTLLGGTNYATPSDRVKPTDLNDTFNAAAGFLNWCGKNFNDLVQLLFNADYLGFDSRLSNSGIPSLDNTFYSTFTSNNADVSENLDYNATNDLYETIDWSTIQGNANYYAIDVYATTLTISSITNVTRVQIRENVWRFYSIQTSLEVARALVIENLFKPTDVTDGSTSPIITSVTVLTALKTSESDDVGMRGHYGYASWFSNVDDPYTSNNYQATFSDTTLNTRIDGWGVTTGNSGTIGSWSKWGSSDNGTTKFVSAASTGGNGDSWGTDQSAARNSNETNGKLNVSLSNTDININMGCGGFFFFKSGTLGSWTITTGTPGQTNTDEHNYDYLNTGGIPALVLQAESLEEQSTLIFKDTVPSTSNAVLVINSQIDATSSEQRSLSADEGSNYIDVENAEIARPSVGTEFWRKIVVTRTDLTKIDKITEQAGKYNIV